MSQANVKKPTQKFVPLGPPPDSDFIPLRLVSFGPLYHALHHPAIRDRLGLNYTNPIDLSLLGGILKSTMEPFTSLKLYLQAAQELGLLKVHHQGSRCLLRVIQPNLLQFWSNYSPESVLIQPLLPTQSLSSSMSSAAQGNHEVILIPKGKDALDPRNKVVSPLNLLEITPFIPLLHAYCAARLRYPPPIRTPAIGPLLKPYFARGELNPWRKLSEYLSDAERIGIVILTRLGVNGDVEVGIQEHVCSVVWPSIRAQYGAFRELPSDDQVGSGSSDGPQPEMLGRMVPEINVALDASSARTNHGAFEGRHANDDQIDEEEEEPLTFTVRAGERL
jgi:hypothetical protein